MKRPMKVIIPAMALLFAVLAVAFVYAPERTITDKAFDSREYELSFSYPPQYFEHAVTMTGQRKRHTITLLENTEENRALVRGETLAGEWPPSITIDIFQNDLDRYTTYQFIQGTNFTNFELSDGMLRQTKVATETAQRFHATGLYENENVVIARDDFVYVFSVRYLTPEDEIRGDFEKVLESVRFK